MNSRSHTGALTHEQRERFAGALERVGGDEDMLVVLAEMAAEDAPAMLQKLEDELELRHREAAAHTAHALKGLLSTFETSSPVDDLQPVIDAARENEIEESVRLFKTIRAKLHLLLSQITSLTQAG